MTYYTSITEIAYQYVAPALGEYADEYDIEEIAREIATPNHEYNEEGREITSDRFYYIDEEEIDFWAVAAQHEN